MAKVAWFYVVLFMCLAFFGGIQYVGETNEYREYRKAAQDSITALNGQLQAEQRHSDSLEETIRVLQK